MSNTQVLYIGSFYVFIKNVCFNHVKSISMVCARLTLFGYSVWNPYTPYGRLRESLPLGSMLFK